MAGRKSERDRVSRRRCNSIERVTAMLRDIEARIVQLCLRTASMVVLVVLCVAVIMQYQTGTLLESSPLLWVGYAGIFAYLVSVGAIAGNPTEFVGAFIAVGFCSLAVVIFIITFAL